MIKEIVNKRRPKNSRKKPKKQTQPSMVELRCLAVENNDSGLSSPDAASQMPPPLFANWYMRIFALDDKLSCCHW